MAAVELIDDFRQGAIAKVELDEGGMGEPVDVGPAIEHLQESRDPDADPRIPRVFGRSEGRQRRRTEPLKGLRCLQPLGEAV